MCLLALLGTPAAAQPTTEDGIRATLRGDYQEAARILRPLADDSAHPDPVAQFFLAVLYETGHGVRPDQARACGLFLSAASRQHPFAEQAAAIAAIMRQQLGDGASLLCVADERWQGGPPQSFVLGPGHRVTFADTSVRVTYGDQEQRTHVRLPFAAAFLPIQYTPLDVRRPGERARHFFQWFLWVPDKAGNPSSWTLQWMLSEVVAAQWIPITGEQALIVVNGATSPASYPTANLVRLSVNSNGEAQFTVVGGISPRTELIASQGSR